MNKLELQHSSLSYRPAEEMVSVPADLAPDGRLIVLIPADADCTSALKRIWKLGTTTGMPIQLISLCKEVSAEPRLRRELITMSALIQDGRIHAEAKVEIGTSWAEVVKHNLQAGDMVVCFAEQRAGLLHRPLSQILQTNTKAPVYIMSGLIRQTSSQSTWLSQILAWGGSVGIILGSLALQVQITALPQNWVQTAVMILSFLGEIGLIWGWNSLFS